mmetsp:Transcript_62242/g.136284  ORF Transcript_62242/g.136284 Transcript_62242/m.136284 type:complete len:263 (+) Transcript_62242:419-1207(+)
MSASGARTSARDDGSRRRARGCPRSWRLGPERPSWATTGDGPVRPVPDSPLEGLPRTSAASPVPIASSVTPHDDAAVSGAQEAHGTSARQWSVDFGIAAFALVPAAPVPPARAWPFLPPLVLSVAWRRRAAQRCGAVPPRLSQTLRAAPRAATSPAPRGSSPGSPFFFSLPSGGASVLAPFSAELRPSHGSPSPGRTPLQAAAWTLPLLSWPTLVSFCESTSSSPLPWLLGLSSKPPQSICLSPLCAASLVPSFLLFFPSLL